jgi:hypothetical protein
MRLMVRRVKIHTIPASVHISVFIDLVMTKYSRGVQNIGSNATQASLGRESLSIQPTDVSNLYEDGSIKNTHVASWQGAALSPPKLGPV